MYCIDVHLFYSIFVLDKQIFIVVLHLGLLYLYVLSMLFLLFIFSGVILGVYNLNYFASLVMLITKIDLFYYFLVDYTKHIIHMLYSILSTDCCRSMYTLYIRIVFLQIYRFGISQVIENIFLKCCSLTIM